MLFKEILKGYTWKLEDIDRWYITLKTEMDSNTITRLRLLSLAKRMGRQTYESIRADPSRLDEYLSNYALSIL